MSGFSNPIVGGTALRIPAIQSPNYSPGVAGWIVKINGDAEFNNLTIRGTFNGTDFIIDANGAFFYSGTPAAGNLIASITTNSGTDSFGNTYLGGITTYSGTEFASLNVGNLLLGQISAAANAGGMSIAAVDAIAASSPTTAAHPTSADWFLVSGTATTTPISAAGYPHHEAYGTVWLNDAAIKAVDNGNVWTPESWHSPSYNASWAASTSYGGTTCQSLRYRKDAEDNVWLEGAFKATGAAGASVFALPSTYFDANATHFFPVMEHTAAATFITGGGDVSTAGNFNINLGAGFTRNNGDEFYVNAKFPLGNIG
jgi:hypothetical protein